MGCFTSCGVLSHLAEGARRGGRCGGGRFTGGSGFHARESAGGDDGRYLGLGGEQRRRKPVVRADFGYDALKPFQFCSGVSLSAADQTGKEEIFAAVGDAPLQKRGSRFEETEAAFSFVTGVLVRLFLVDDCWQWDGR
jgi:hypothetical protein